MINLLPGFLPDYSLISGLEYLENYISEDEENFLLSVIDKQSWITELKRRVQHYGYKYDYKANTVSAESVDSIPEFILSLCLKLVKDSTFNKIPNQVIINEYLPGLGISAHIDALCFGDTICSLSLGADYVMNFLRKEVVIPKLLARRSLLILKGDARFKWQHEIQPRKIENFLGQKFQRGKRVSITFRNVI